MRLLLDTAILIYAVEAPERLSKRAIAALENAENVLELSAISLTEIAIKTSLGKLKVTSAVARQALQDLDIHITAIYRRPCLKIVRITPSSQRSFRPPNHRSGIIREDSCGDARRKVQAIQRTQNHLVNGLSLFTSTIRFQ